MKIKVGLNGFGRIGRAVLRIVEESNDYDFEVVAINARANSETLAHLFQYDSSYGIFKGEVEVKDENSIVVNGKEIKITRAGSPAEIPWKELGVDIVIDNTGKFKTKEAAIGHIEAGAKKVIITCPAKGEDLTVVLGVNDEKYDPQIHHILSNASCTTNCLAPVAKVLDESFGIENGMMTTVHAYTNDQQVLDKTHKDLRRARACAESIIPTTTGAAKAVSLVLPQLEGKLNGFSLRVPTPTVSVVDLVVNLKKKDVTAEEVNEALKKASENELRGILGYCEKPLVSVDFKGDPRSSIVDAPSTMVMNDGMVKVISWYDNEWGYAVRTVDLANIVSKAL
ncbi:MAG: type I glyceraldehyde-3-phosphate dehydrogenase [Peptostreptococcus porci]|uniref:type I glyceraldehyde-3-phosphate dehydrogenase n=1 Tax=Peptostreptococcus porci TaxID=2652282 RepID=UPI0023F3591F|nr:type I glyceraldehyde-3-phosphate dehydrogenase [Peptostreptococcus porci]MDD7182966.1 type I glyceraldehyde-3-phosphate dehydrogenase [Peptostreptococcus porci]MDY5480420.1 type I glyceraldehyde-3-phosphate dehydrogenase [Peptostreptococcus porci]MDY5963860.1 type I glyceraldehyde-3-phosphate dehydrogenase [Peptostreptococcus porci]